MRKLFVQFINNFKNLEKALFSVGAITVALTSFLLLNSDRLGSWLGLVSENKFKEVAKIEIVHNQARRKQLDAPDFETVSPDQPVFNHDTLITGSNSTLTLALSDGGMVQLEPDTLIQIESQNEDSVLRTSDLVVDVLKGSVSGISAQMNIQVRMGGEIQVLSPPTSPITTPTPKPIPALAQATASPTPMALATATPLPTPNAANSCKIASNLVLPPQLGTQYYPKIVLQLNCGPQDRVSLSVKSSTNTSVRTLALIAGPNHTFHAEYLATMPAAYTFTLNQGNPNGVGSVKLEEKTISVPRGFLTLAWEGQTLLCDRGVEWKPTNEKGIRWSLVEALSGNRERIFRQDSDMTHTSFKKLNDLRLPAQVRVQLDLSTGFNLQTPAFAIGEWKTCTVLKLPEDGKILPYDPGSDIYFTWNYISTGDQFVLEIATDKYFKNMLFSGQVAQNFKVVGIGRKGTIYWRVKEMRTHSVSDISTLIVK